MKVSILICFFLLGVFNIIGQTEEYPGLYSDDFEEIIHELELIEQNNDQGAISILHSLIEEQTPYIQLNYLRVLSSLEDAEIISYCNDFILRSDNFAIHEYRESPLEMKVEATKIMIENGDFSKINYIFEYFDLYKPELNSLQRDVLTLFPLIASNVPATLNQIENGLLDIFNNSTFIENRFFALNTYEEIFNSSVLNIAINGISDDDQSIRNLSISFLVEYTYPNLNNVLRNRLLEDPGRSIRTKISQLLLTYFGEPSDLKFIIEYQPTEIHPTSKSLIGFYIQNFIPPKPDTLNWNGLATRLIDYTNEMYGYGWIADEETRKHYLRYLTTIIESITETGQTVAACSIIQSEILERLEEDLSTELVTKEAYKFLHYYAIYIKEEIEEVFGACLNRNFKN